MPNLRKSGYLCKGRRFSAARADEINKAIEILESLIPRPAAGLRGVLPGQPIRDGPVKVHRGMSTGAGLLAPCILTDCEPGYSCSHRRFKSGKRVVRTRLNKRARAWRGHWKRSWFPVELFWIEIRCTKKKLRHLLVSFNFCISVLTDGSSFSQC